MRNTIVRKKDMTLVELVVVLSILVAITSVAIVSLDGLSSNSRYSETKRRGTMALNVVDGPSAEKTGAFVADLGRLPCVANTLRGAELAELFYASDAFSAVDPTETYAERTFANPDTDWGGAAPGTTFNFSSDTRTIRLQCGWRGPYIQLNAEKFRDGWGNDWLIKTTGDDTWNGVASWSGTPPLDKTIFGIRSLGKNDKTDASAVDWENRDTSFSFEESKTSSELTVAVMRVDNSVSPAIPVPVDSSFIDHIRVAVFAPYITPDGVDSDNVKRILARNDGGSHALSVSPAADAGFPHFETLRTPTWSGYHSVTLRGLSPGPRKIYVYGFKNSVAPTNKYGSRLLDLELKPGHNIVTVYLVEAL
jgi:type II secretory pathway pseudopilin PulG